MRQTWREVNAYLGRYLTPAVRVLLIANVLVFIIQVLMVLVPDGMERFVLFFGQVPLFVVKRLFVWQFVTYMFLHGSFFHLLFNMLLLWFLGPRLEYRWGSARFLKFYFIVGIGSGLFHFVLAWLTQRPEVALIGASGALYGILLAWALYWPNDRLLLYGIFPVQVKFLVIVLALFAFFSSAGGGGGDISHITHLGGLVVALLYLKGGDWMRRLGGGRGGRGGGRPEAESSRSTPPGIPIFTRQVGRERLGDSRTARNAARHSHR